MRWTWFRKKKGTSVLRSTEMNALERRVVHGQVLSPDDDFARSIQGRHGPEVLRAIVKHYHIADEDLEGLARRLRDLGDQEDLDKLLWYRRAVRHNPGRTVLEAGLRYARGDPPDDWERKPNPELDQGRQEPE